VKAHKWFFLKHGIDILKVLGDPCVDGRSILRWIIRKWDVDWI